MDFRTPNQSRDIEVHTLFLILNNMKVATIYLLNGILERICNLHSSGTEAQRSSLPKQRGVTEFQPKRVVSTLTLMDKRQTRNPNLTLKGFPEKFCSLFGQKAHKTQQITLKTQQITLFHPKRRFILSPNIPRTDPQLKIVTPSD